MNSTSPLALGVTLTTAATLSAAADRSAVEALLAKLRNPDDKIRGPAWQSAGPPEHRPSFRSPQ